MTDDECLHGEATESARAEGKFEATRGLGQGLDGRNGQQASTCFSARANAQWWQAQAPSAGDRAAERPWLRVVQPPARAVPVA